MKTKIATLMLGLFLSITPVMAQNQTDNPTRTNETNYAQTTDHDDDGRNWAWLGLIGLLGLLGLRKRNVEHHTETRATTVR